MEVLKSSFQSMTTMTRMRLNVCVQKWRITGEQEAQAGGEEEQPSLQHHLTTWRWRRGWMLKMLRVRGLLLREVRQKKREIV
jgi:hypothetical protein